MKKLMLSLIIGIMLLGFVSATTWDNGLGVGLHAYYNFTTLGSAVNNATNGFILARGTTRLVENATTFIGSAAYFDGATCLNPIAPSGDIVFNYSGTTQSTQNFWFNVPTGIQYASAKGGNGASGGWEILIRDDDPNWVRNGGTSFTIGTGYPPIGKWQMITLIKNATGGKLYINGTLNREVPAWASTLTTWNYTLGCAEDGGYGYAKGYIDEMGWWNRTLSAAEVTQLYNAGSGITWIPDASATPTMTSTISYPVGGFNTSTTTVGIGCNFTANVEGTNNVTSAKLNVTTVGGIQAYTNTISSLNVISYNGTWTTSALAEGVYNFTCKGYGNQGVNSTTTNRTFTIDTTVPSITITQPTADAITNSSVKATITDTYLNTTCKWSSDNGITNASFTCGNDINPTTQGNITVKIWAYDYAGNTNNASIKYFLDTIVPNITKITPSTNYTNNTKVNFSFNLQDLASTTHYTNMTNIIAYWQMENKTEQISPTNYNLVAFSVAPQFIAGKVSNGSYTNNTGGSAWQVTQLTNEISLNETNADYTIAFWVYHTSISFGGTQRYMSNYDWQILESARKFIVTGFTTTPITGINDLNANQWYYMTIIKNSSSVCLLENGIIDICSTNDGLNNYYAPKKLAIQSDWDATDVMIGTIDEVAIWKRALPISEIQAYYGTTGASGLKNATLNITSNETGLQVNYTSWTFSDLWQSIVSYTSDFVDGVYNYAITIYDNAQNLFSNSNYQVIVDTINPTLRFYSPTGLYGLERGNYNIDINYTANDTTLSTCWYSIDGGTNTSIAGCNNVTVAITNLNLQHRLNLYVNDSIGTLTSTSSIWDIATENGQTWNNNSQSGLLQTHAINVSYNSSRYNLLTYLNYNGTNYTAVNNNNSGDNLIVYRDLTIPIVASQTNFTFYWNLLLTNLSGSTTTFQSTNNNQTVSLLLIDNCTTNNMTLLNFTMVDEESQTKINGTILFDGTIYSYATRSAVLTSNQSFAYNWAADSRICLSNITGLYSLDYTIQHYPNATYFKKYRMVQNQTVGMTSTSNNLTLYNLLGTSGYTFRIIVVGNLLNANGNSDLLVEVQKKYIPENTFKLVESSVTGANGETVAHLTPGTEIYNFVVSYMGQVLGTFNNYQVACQNAATGQCSITLNLAQSTASANDFTNYGNITQVLVYDNSTGTLSLTYSSTDGNAHTVQQLVILSDNYANNTICNASSYGTSGTINCLIPALYRNTTIISRSSSDGTFIANSFFSLGGFTDYFGIDLYIEVFMFTTLVLMFLANPVIIVIGAMLGIMLAIILLWMSSGALGAIVATIIYFVVAGFIIVWQLGRRV